MENTVSKLPEILQNMSRCDCNDYQTTEAECTEEHEPPLQNSSDDGCKDTDITYVVDKLDQQIGSRPGFRYLMRWGGSCKAESTANPPPHTSAIY